MRREDIRREVGEYEVFTCEKHKVALMHIVGSPGRYQPKALQIIREEKPTIFVAGHSHILKIMYDKYHNLLFINPGAAGLYGIHTRLTMLRFEIEGEEVKNMDIYDIPKQTPVR